MKKIGTAVLLLILLLAVSVFATNEYVTKDYNFQGFTGVSVASGMKLDVKQGGSFEVKVQTKENNFDRIRVEQRGNILEFSILPFSNIHERVEISVTIPVLTFIELSGGSIANIAINVPDKNFNAELSGGSSLTGNLQTQRLEIAASGGCRTEMTGRADSLKINASGGSRVKLDNFSVKVSRLDLSGGSMVDIYVTELMDINASGGSRIFYKGNPRLGKTSFSGGAGVQSRN